MRMNKDITERWGFVGAKWIINYDFICCISFMFTPCKSTVQVTRREVRKKPFPVLFLFSEVHNVTSTLRLTSLR